VGDEHPDDRTLHWQGALAGRLPHYPILDALRFVLALWVAIGRYGVFPLFTWVDASTSLGRFVTHAWNTVVFGTPAAIVFFVLSSFCISLAISG
jgi:peptidoglycan/LPS O-acetylase OafA/YrhL